MRFAGDHVMRHRLQFRLLVLAGLVALPAGLAVGCAKEERPTVEVKGKVTVGSKPVTTGVIILAPDVGKGNKVQHEARGTIDDQGNFTALTDGNTKGVEPGWYKVGVVSTKKDPKNEYAVPVSLIPEKYQNPQTSGLSMEVKENAPPGYYNLTLSD